MRTADVEAGKTRIDASAGRFFDAHALARAQAEERLDELVRFHLTVLGVDLVTQKVAVDRDDGGWYYTVSPADGDPS